MPESTSLRITYPQQLPISARTDDIARAITDHQVVIVAGETGSGKTTQLPKICLDLGRGVDGMIGHTQPRRIAARTVAERIAFELSSEVGQHVGYQVRFTDRSGPATSVKVMTDGILLNEIQRDRNLRRYDTIIIDEAHERSLNIDFLLGYLKRLLPKRPDLKVIITSATIDPERFSQHFDAAPVIEVSGRMYPVEVRYREPGETAEQTEEICAAVGELIAEGPGDILVFCSGEREIRDAADSLRKMKPARPIDAFDVLPLYARLSAAEQHRVFASHTERRVVLATNIAETSLTVPGIRYVVDTGFARISRYSARTKVQRLPIEPISQASADQRKGRCGRLEDGICIRLYSEEDFASRPAYTDPEIVRTNLASVILQMTALGLGDVARFPFVQPPDQRSVKAGVQLLEEIGAVSTRKQRRRLTKIGRTLVRIPVDPRLGRMLVAADRNGCLQEVVTVVAALSMQDPRERPADQQQSADSHHGRFTDRTSDFAAILNLWRYLQDKQRELGSNAFRRLCRREFLNYLRVREWQDLNHQLRAAAKQAGLRLNRQPADAEAIHKSLLAGLLSHVGMRDHERRDYQGARGTRFGIFPGSGLFKKQPDFVMAAELVETSRLWARTNAAIDPRWAETVGAHLVKRSYAEPHWEKSRGATMATEKVTLYGVPLISDRRVNYGRIDPETARDLFIRHALVQGEWDTDHRFLAANQARLEEAEDLEHRARTRGILVDDQVLFDFYDQRLPDDITSTRHFDAWWKKARRHTPHLLDFSLDMLVEDTAATVSESDFPDVWRHGEAELALDYRFDPGNDEDGVTVDIPVAALPQAREEDFSWSVPGLRHELVVALLRSLPKAVRVAVVPVPDHARAFLDSAAPGEESLPAALARYVRRSTGEQVAADSFDLDRLPAHLRMRYRVLDDAGEVLGEDRDLAVLQNSLAGHARESVAATGATLERSGLTTWDFDSLPAEVTQTRAGYEVSGYPALVDHEDSVAIEVLTSEPTQAEATLRGVRRLVALQAPAPTKQLLADLSNADRLTIGVNPDGNAAALVEDCWLCAIGTILQRREKAVWDRAGFDDVLRAVHEDATAIARATIRSAVNALAAAHTVERRLSGRAEMSMLPALTDMKDQLSRLVYRGFVADAGTERLEDYPRYLAAMEVRLDKLAEDPRADAAAMATMRPVLSAYLDRVAAQQPHQPPPAGLIRVRWMLQELRVSLWAQHLGTAERVSVQRVRRALAEL